MKSLTQQRIAEHFGRNLRRCRKEAGLSQGKLAIVASLHATGISEMERGLKLARADTVVRLASALQVPVAELFDGLSWTPGTMMKGVPMVDGEEIDPGDWG